MMTLDIEQIKADLAAGRTDDASEYPEGYTRRIEKLIAEVERLQADNERLTFVYLADTKISGALVAENERLRAELAERERQIEALGKARLSGLASGGLGE